MNRKYVRGEFCAGSRDYAACIDKNLSGYIEQAIREGVEETFKHIFGEVGIWLCVGDHGEIIVAVPLDDNHPIEVEFNLLELVKDELSWGDGLKDLDALVSLAASLSKALAEIDEALDSQQDS